MQRFLAVCLLVLLLGPTLVQAQETQDTPGIELPTLRWNRTNLQALVVTQENQTWWKPYFVDLSQKAVDQWNQALTFFVDKYIDYAYLSCVSISLSVSNETLPGYDIYITFAETLAIESQETLGLTTTFPYRNGTIEKAILQLSSKSGSIDLTGSDERDVTNHELGHALGLGHSNSTKDMMYPYYDFFSSNNAISTLDLYGLAITFSWVNSPNESTSAPDFITLPSSITFDYAPVTNPTPKGLEDNPVVKALVIFFSIPYVAIIFSVLIFFLIASILLYWRNRRSRRRRK